MTWRGSSFSKLIFATCLLGMGFYAGYLVTINGMLGALQANNAPLSQSTQINTERKAQHTKHAWLDIENALINDAHQIDDTSVYLVDETDIDDTSAVPEVLEYAWRDPNDIIAMFDELLSLSNATSDEEIRAFSQAIDQLRNALSDSPTQLAILTEYMQSLDVESVAFRYITAIMQGLPDNKGQAAMQSVALRLSQQGDVQSQQQFLHLVSNSYESTENPEILAALVDIALYSEASPDTKLQALDLVMPFQITNVEKQQILSHINTMIDSAVAGDKGALLNHAFRFSSHDEREIMANQYIDAENDMELRYSVLDGLHAGSVPRSQQIKERLFTIVQDPSDPLNQQAAHALMYVFDISNDEYQLIKQSNVLPTNDQR